VVPKPDGTGRLCVVFRQFNAVTVPDPFPMLCIVALLVLLGEAVFKRNPVRPRQQKVDALLDFPILTNRKPVQSLLSLAGYYGKCQLSCADIMLPLTKLLKRNTRFEWSVAADATFLDLRSRFASRPIRKPPKYDIVLCVAVEAQITVREQYGFRLFQAPFSWTQLRRNQESDVWPMGSGTATILLQCPASCWKRQSTSRSVESTFQASTRLFPLSLVLRWIV